MQTCKLLYSRQPVSWAFLSPVICVFYQNLLLDLSGAAANTVDFFLSVSYSLYSQGNNLCTFWPERASLKMKSKVRSMKMPFLIKSLSFQCLQQIQIHAIVILYEVSLLNYSKEINSFVCLKLMDMLFLRSVLRDLLNHDLEKNPNQATNQNPNKTNQSPHTNNFANLCSDLCF